MAASKIIRPNRFLSSTLLAGSSIYQGANAQAQEEVGSGGLSDAAGPHAGKAVFPFVLEAKVTFKDAVALRATQT